MIRKSQYCLYLIMLLVNEDKKQPTKHQKQPEAYITNDQYEESPEQRKGRAVPVKTTYSEANKFGKKTCVISDSHLNRIKRNIFQKLVKGEKHTLTFFEELHLRE